MYLNTDDHIDVSSLNIPKIELDQQIFLVDNLTNAIKQNLVTSDRKQIVIEAPTGSGKSFTIINYTMLELAKQRPDWKVFFFIAPSQENIDEPLSTAKQLDETYLGTRQIRVYDSEQFNEMHKNKSRPAGDINFFFVTTQFFYSKYKKFDHKKPNALKLIVPNIAINDEAHRGLGVPDAETTKQDTGITNKKWDPKWFRMMEQLLLAGCDIAHLTGTPTDSQKMKTKIGANKYFALPAMPKYREKSVFTNFLYKGTDVDAEYTLQAALKEYKNQVEIVKVLQDKISNDTWNIMAPSITKTMPAMILPLG
jgi:type I site-specific restriction-modification system R (restriction) subunit